MQQTRPAFYPDRVAQVYPWLAGVRGPGQDPRQAWEKWKQAFGAGWIERRYDTHPWGLVALAAAKLGDTASAACWTSHSDSLRGSNSWNVLEEAVWQSLRARFTQPQLLDPQACVEFFNAEPGIPARQTGETPAPKPSSLGSYEVKTMNAQL